METLQQVLLSRYGIELPCDKIALIEKNLEAVIEKNKVINLTRIEDPEEARIKHLEDSLAAYPVIESAPQGTYCDIGTGGGFPGIPLAIATGRQTVLVDSVKKKVAAIEDIVRELGLNESVECWAGRIEDLGAERKSQFAVVTARALSSLDSLVELASPLLKNHGLLVCYKANLQQEELQYALDIQDIVAVRFREKIEYQLSDGSNRCLVVFEKSGKPKIKLPRRIGLAQHQPLRKK